MKLVNDRLPNPILYVYMINKHRRLQNSGLWLIIFMRGMVNHISLNKTWFIVQTMSKRKQATLRMILSYLPRSNNQKFPHHFNNKKIAFIKNCPGIAHPCPGLQAPM